jgi:DNA-binding NarL/FixJ family response regulator
MDRIRIVIADDHPVVRAGLQEMLRGQPDFEIVGEASNGVEAVALVNQVQPDVVLMDLRMTLLDGAEATAQIHAQQTNTAVLVLANYPMEYRPPSS